MSKSMLTALAADEEQAWSEKVVKDEYPDQPWDSELVRRGKVEELDHFKYKGSGEKYHGLGQRETKSSAPGGSAATRETRRIQKFVVPLCARR